MGWGALVGAVAGGLMGSSQAKKDRQAAEDARAQALAQFAGIDLPTVQEQLYDLETPDYVGDLAAIQEQAVDIGPSAMEDIAVDPRLQAAQMQALEQLMGRADEGLSAEALNELQQTQRATQAASQAKQEQILQSMQQRGLGGAGAELATRLMAAQQAADQAGQMGREIAARSAAEDNASIDALAKLAGGMRSQDFGEQSDIAKSRDILEQFKAQNLQGVRQRNVSNQQQAAARNLGERQRLADLGAQTRNIMEQRRASLPGDQFDRQLSLSAARSGQYGAQADASDKSAAERAGMWAGIGKGIGKGISAWESDDKDKE